MDTQTFIVKVNQRTIEPILRLLIALFPNKTGQYSHYQAHAMKDKIKWLYITEGQIFGWDGETVRYRNEDIIDTTQSPTHQITIDSKTIIISDESYQALKKSLL